MAQVEKISSEPNSKKTKKDNSLIIADTKEFEIRLKFGEETHLYIRDCIKQADQKAAFFFAVATAILTYLNSFKLTTLWIINPNQWGLIHAISLISTIGLVIGCFFCVLTVMPRLKGTKKSIIFFSAICEYSNASEYSDDILNCNISQLCIAKYKHIYEISDISHIKYRMLFYGFIFCITGVFSSLFLLLLN